MTDESQEPDEHDLGAPIAELDGFEMPVDDRFDARVRGRIDRRLLAGDLVELAWHGPLAILLHLLDAPLSWLSGRTPR